MKPTPTVPILTVLGVLTGASLWGIVYSRHFGTIEYDGPAGLGMLTSLVMAGIIFGSAGIAYESRRQNSSSFIKHLKPLIATLAVAVSLTGIMLGNYAMHKWDYEAAHKSECRLPDNIRPYACQ